MENRPLTSPKCHFVHTGGIGPDHYWEELYNCKTCNREASFAYRFKDTVPQEQINQKCAADAHCPEEPYKTNRYIRSLRNETEYLQRDLDRKKEFLQRFEETH
jgi:hypothetical protein